MLPKSNVLKLSDFDYPKVLKEIHKPPQCLNYLGDIALLRRCCVAVVGTRNCSDYGAVMTRRITEDLVNRGVVIVSGLALGIDTIAHETALDLGGKTIAILGSGLKNIYPVSNFSLARRIEENGLLLSEFEDRVGVLPFHFPMRNRIISGLCDAVVVVEAPKKSGALITAKYALEQGKDIFVVPGDVDRESSIGVLELLQSGVGFPVKNGIEILDHMGMQKSLPGIGNDLPNEEQVLSPEENDILKVLSFRNWYSADFLTRKLMISVVNVMSVLSLLEIKGLIEVREGMYRKV